MKKIIFLEYVQTFGGARKSTIELAKRLSNNYDIEIIDVNGCCQPFIETCNKTNLPFYILDPQKQPFLLSSKSKFVYIANLLFFAIYAIKIHFRLTRHLSKNKESIIIVNNSKVLSFLLPKPRHCKIVLFARGWFTKRQISKIDLRLYRSLVDYYACVSWATSQAIYGAGIASLNHLHVVHNAIETDTLKGEGYHEEKGDLNILFSGGFLPAKGQLTAIKIAERLKTKGIIFRIILTGIIYKGDVSQRYYEHIQQFIQKKGLEKYVKIVAGKNNVIDYFRWCDIFVHPSDTEGLPRVVMEAMALKKPVIANAVGGVTDYIINGYTGFLTLYNDVDDYVNKILLLHNNHELYKSITTNAYQMVTSAYTPEAQLEQMNQLLEKL